MPDFLICGMRIIVAPMSQIWYKINELLYMQQICVPPHSVMPLLFLVLLSSLPPGSTCFFLSQGWADLLEPAHPTSSGLEGPLDRGSFCWCYSKFFRETGSIVCTFLMCIYMYIHTHQGTGSCGFRGRQVVPRSTVSKLETQGGC